MKNTDEAFLEFFNVIKRLRAPDGCPWDIKQTPMTMRTPLIEEVYEAVDAIEEHDKGGAIEGVREELGDVMLNSLMISYMFEQAGKFSVSDVFDDVREKLIRRHPHVFGETAGYAGPESKNKTKTADDVLSQWDNIKKNVEHKDSESVFDSIPKAFPPLLRAFKLHKKAAKTGFDWTSVDGVLDKVDEEVSELKEAIGEADQEHIYEEFGDVLCVLVNLARFLKIDPVTAMNSANEKFERRFRAVEKKMKANGFEMSAENVDKMSEFWDEVKKLEKE